MKPRYKRRIIWTIATILATAALATVIVPPFVTLNSLKPRLVTAIENETGIRADIRGAIHFSMLGGATIVAHDIQIPNGNIGSAMFTIPLSSVFDIENAKFGDDITIYDADIKISSLGGDAFSHPIDIYNSTVNFHGKEYEIIRATLDGGNVNGTVRTNEHKYDIKTDNDKFVITNNNNNLNITGVLYDNGAAMGTIAIETDNVNKFFEFSTPKIPGTVAATADFAWDGGTGFDFTNINGQNFAGNIELKPDGAKIVQITSPNIDYDFSFLTRPSEIFTDTTLNLDLYGRLKFGPRTFNHLKIIAAARPSKFKIENVVADDIVIAGGYIDAAGAHNIMITLPVDNKSAMCIFSGSPDNWRCSAFSYNNMTGSLSVTNDTFDIIVQSPTKLPDIDAFVARLHRFGTSGRIHFAFADAAGTIDVTPDTNKVTYSFANNRTLGDMGYDLFFVPEFIRTARGDFNVTDGITTFTPYNQKWNITLGENNFVITGDNFKKWLPDIDLQSVRDLPYTISGKFAGRTISDLIIQIAGMEFSGRAAGDTLTLHTNLLNVDAFIDPEFSARFAELEFLTTHPIVLPFNLPVKISLDANRINYDGIEFANFVYSLKDNVQTFSISDHDRGNLLATISRDKTDYAIFMQLNRFVTNGDFLSDAMPLNLRDTMITAEINMRTNGYTAHDLIYNLHGDVDMSFDGGYVIGLGLDQFFANANNLTTFNAEYILSDALSAGETRLKKMHIVGKYENGDFITSAPFTLQMPHTDATGEMDISDGKMMVMLNMTLRATSPVPQPINMRILPDNTRDYSLTEIMTNFDAGFMREFVKTHSQF